MIHSRKHADRDVAAGLAHEGPAARRAHAGSPAGRAETASIRCDPRSKDDNDSEREQGVELGIRRNRLHRGRHRRVDRGFLCRERLAAGGRRRVLAWTRAAATQAAEAARRTRRIRDRRDDVAYSVTARRSCRAPRSNRRHTHTRTRRAARSTGGREGRWGDLRRHRANGFGRRCVRAAAGALPDTARATTCRRARRHTGIHFDDDARDTARTGHRSTHLGCVRSR